jgi:hypothetical protein
MFASVCFVLVFLEFVWRFRSLFAGLCAWQLRRLFSQSYDSLEQHPLTAPFTHRNKFIHSPDVTDHRDAQRAEQERGRQRCAVGSRGLPGGGRLLVRARDDLDALTSFLVL